METHETIEARADFSKIRYGMCWEDADVLLEALAVQPGERCLSIAAAGDNALALLARAPSRVVAVDLSPAQLACLELRVAAFRRLSHPELLQLVGLSPGGARGDLYRCCRDGLSADARAFWDARPGEIEAGIGKSGKFERYLATFRRRVLPLVHSDDRVRDLLAPRSREDREVFYHRTWDTVRWRFLFNLFFSRVAMGRLGRDPRFFDQVEGRVADRLLARARHALTQLDPSENPYLQMILLEGEPHTLPFAFRAENFDAIRANLDALEIRRASVEATLETEPDDAFDAYNLSDLFEYIPAASHVAILRQIVRTGAPNARVAYWNLFVPRRRPGCMADDLGSLRALSNRLHAVDKAFFYADFVVERVKKGNHREHREHRERLKAGGTAPRPCSGQAPGAENAGERRRGRVGVVGDVI